jgi:DNA-binding transcriptional regulator LsrR (DeoR family)
MGLADRRQALNVAVERVRKGRHELLRAMFLLALNEGSSRAEIARVWHVSRQLVSRMTGEELED